MYRVSRKIWDFFSEWFRFFGFRLLFFSDSCLVFNLFIGRNNVTTKVLVLCLVFVVFTVVFLLFYYITKKKLHTHTQSHNSYRIRNLQCPLSHFLSVCLSTLTERASEWSTCVCLKYRRLKSYMNLRHLWMLKKKTNWKTKPFQSKCKWK